MFLTRCSLCEHDNPEHSKFCNGCGASLLRMGVCARCGALNEVTAAACHRCDAVLLESAAAQDTHAPTEPNADLEALRRQLFGGEQASGRAAPNPLPPEPPEPHAAESGLHSPPHRSTRRHRLSVLQRVLIASSAVGAVFGSLGYFTYSQLTVTNVAGLLPATQVETRAADGPGGRIVTVRAAVPGVPATLRSGTATWATDEAAPPSTQEPVATPSAAVTGEPRAQTDHRAVGGKRAANANGVRQSVQTLPAPAHVGPCTAAIAALGLCTPETTPAKE